ncbi:MAG TPA: hypothetical protein VGI93_07540 [Steroidobacteraceae bacterium]|jgi:hypothetical protein
MMARLLSASFLLLALLLGFAAHAEPYLAVEEGYKCNVCHVNPTGGGLRNDFGVTYAKVLLPEQSIGPEFDKWNGKVADILHVGGDLRADWSRTTAPNTPATDGFALEQFRVYGDLAIIPNKLGIYVDEQIAPNGSQNEEAYVRYGNTNNGGFYFKGGQFYLPFGWRLQDQSAFVRQLTGINMTTPDKGVEIGYEKPHWSAQLDFTNGSANTGSGTGHEVTGQVQYVQSIWRLGLAASSEQAQVGNRRMAGIFAGLKTGPVAWLGEFDVVHDDSFAPAETQAAALFEGDWRLMKGHNLKLTAEWEDPDRRVPNDQFTRYSLVYEYTPIPFLQLRGGYRRDVGIPQSPSENQRQLFVELHGYY